MKIIDLREPFGYYRVLIYRTYNKRLFFAKVKEIIMQSNEYKKLEKYVLEAQKGNKEAFSVLYTATYQRVYFYALQLLKSKESAEEIVQDVYTDIMTSISTLENPRAFTAWVYKKTYHLSMNYIRKHKKNVVIEGNAPVFTTLEDEKTESNPEHTCLKDEREQILMKGIDQLSVNHKNVVLMHYYQNLSVNQMAEVMDCSTGTIKSRLNVARKYLKKTLEASKVTNPVFLLFPIGKSIRETLENVSKGISMNATTVNGISGGASGTFIISQTGSVITKGILSSLGIKIAAVSTSLFLAVGTSAGVYHIQKAEAKPKEVKISSVQLENPETYTNEGASLKVKIENEKVDQLYALSESGKTYRSSFEKGVYKIKVYENGSYEIIAKLEDSKDKYVIQVNTVDKGTPVIEHITTEEDLVIITCRDTLSGIDWKKTNLTNQEQQMLIPETIDEEKNQITYRTLENNLTFSLYDQANNTSIYNISEKK